MVSVKRGAHAGRLAGRSRRQAAAPLLLLAVSLVLLLTRQPSGSGPWLSRLVPHTKDGGSYSTAAARELLPRLLRREDQLALERRWGVEPVLAPPSAPPGARIPRILHHVYFPNISSFLEASAGGSSSTREELAQSCRRQMPGWQYVFWDWEAATSLVQKFYPDYYEMFTSLEYIIKKADAIRYFIMHAIGGLYLDLDIECFQPVDSWLENYDVVLQDPGPTNGVVASVPGHPLWLKVLELMKQRWQEDPQRNVVEATGPGLMSSTFKFSLGPGGPKERPEQPDPWSGEHRIYNTDVMVYPQGRYFHPCEWDDKDCHRRLTIQRALGTANLTELAGYHRFAASWAGGIGAGIFSEDALKQQLCG